jgi:mannose-1-phosphate guanylyltransferase / mannose-6-phosphate isomerase
VTANCEDTDTFAQPVILCGGSGTRLWPLSRSGFPKQFLSLTGESTLFQLAAKRLASLGSEDVHIAAPLIVTGEEHRFLVLEQLREANIELGAALLEPIGKNTAPALTLAALAARESGGDPILLVMSADQTINDTVAFNGAIHSAIGQAKRGSIVLLGVTPDHASTGYGYIHAERLSEEKSCADEIFNVSGFIEKPDASTAQSYLDKGGYFWNAGIFVLKASTWLKALESFQPETAKASRLAWNNRSTDSNVETPFVRPGKKEFMSISAESIDYAVMEHCPGSPRFSINMVPLDAGWSDLGTWDAVWQALPKDEDGNARRGDVLINDSRDSLVYASSRLVSLVGADNLIVIETPDAILVVDKSCSQNVKEITNALHSLGRGEETVHRKVHRPWGWYDNIDDGHRFKVKRIQVKPGASLSLQKHRYRAEHWIVVKGTAEITNGEKTVVLHENQSTYIPLGTVHRLANPGTIPLEIIEVQSGSYLGEDDIVRFEDNYGR